MMLRPLLLLVAVVLTTKAALAAPRELTIFSDGSLIELEGTAQKGLVELSLPAPLREGTLRVRPLDGSSIGQVELVPFRMSDKTQNELDLLLEQQSRLEDRLQALDARESIFEAAAKSQSSKAPRKTKTNPDPLTSVRQGTDFAIAQLEAVITARRRTTQELKRVSSRITQLAKSSAGGPTVRIAVSTPNGRVKLAAVLTDNGWHPRYELRLSESGTARLTQLAEASSLPGGYRVLVTPGALAGGIPQQTIPLLPGRATALASWQLPVVQQQITAGPLTRFTISLANNSGQTLPAGPMAIYHQGEFLGTVPLAATAAEATLTVTNPTP